MITAVPGVEVGHWTDLEARTGCTVALFPEGTVASGEVRGAAPATREWVLLDPLKMVERIDAVVLSGGSAYGLAAGDGVMTWLEERGRGFPTPGGPVPIVVGLSLYDLTVGDGSVRPDREAGLAACGSATTEEDSVGLVGAGTGATIGKWRGADGIRPGGLCGAVRRHGDLVVASLVAVNALGDLHPPTSPGLEPDALVAAGWLDRGDGNGEGDPALETAFGNTTIGVVATNARLSKVECQLVAQSAHNGLARAILPVHTRADGDAFVAAATGAVSAQVGAVRELATTVVAEAVGSLLG